jgi:peroxiredoxin
MRKYFIYSVVSVFYVFALSSLALAVPPAPWEIDEIIGQEAPAFTLNDLEDKPISLKDYKGKVMLVNFWATWCPPCKDEIPSLNQLHKKYDGKDFIVLGISTDDSKKDIIKFIKEHKVDFVIPHDRDGKIMREYKVFSLPTSFLIDKQGKIVEKFLGPHDWVDKDFLKKIDNLM